MSRTLTSALKLAAIAAASFTVLSCPALAGSYVVSACSPSSSPGLWAQTNMFSTALVAGNLCSGPAIGPTDGSRQGALYAEDVLNSPANIPDGARAGWTITAPAGTTITAISYYRSLHAYNNPNMISGLFQGDGSALEQCKIPWPFVAGSSIHCDKVNNQAPVTFTGLNTSALFLGVGCRLVDSALACIAGGAPVHAATADLYSARVTLSESGAPTLSSVAGPLWGAGVVWGNVPVTFVASDASGIQEQLVRTDTGQTLISVPQACDFGHTPPCPQQPAGSLNVDTTRVADGARTFSLVVTDAAGNSQIATSPTVLVDNNGPLPPTLTATAQGGGSRVIALSWRNPPSPPSPIARAIVQLCQATCPPATTISASGAAQLTAPAPGVYNVRLWLIDANGRGGEHNAALATVRVPAADGSVPGSQPAARTKVAAVIKGRRLRVSGTIMRSGRVRVSWRSKLGKRTVGTGTRIVTIRQHKIALTFTLSTRARRATTRVAVRAGSRIVAQARARRG
jgi:hypothetical protein